MNEHVLTFYDGTVFASVLMNTNKGETYFNEGKFAMYSKGYFKYFYLANEYLQYIVIQMT